MGSTNITLEDIMNKIVSLENSVSANGKTIQSLETVVLSHSEMIKKIDNKLDDVPHLIENLAEQIQELPFTNSIKREITKEVLSSEERIEKQFGARMIKIENDVKKINVKIGIEK